MKLVIVLTLCLLFLTGLTLAGGNFRFSSSMMDVMEGEAVTMECRYSRRTDDRYLIWGYVAPGTGVIRQLVHWKPQSRVPVYVTPDAHRYVAVKNFARKFMSLKIANATTQDSTRYFCQLTDQAGQENRTDFCGCGTTLNVQPVPPSSPPSVYLQYPPPGEIWHQGSVDLLCLLTGFYPPRVGVAWYMDGAEVSSGISQQPVSRDPRDRYSTVSRLEISGQDWVRADSYRCVVSHSTLRQPIVKEIRTRGFVTPSPCLHPSPPPSLTSETLTNQIVTFACIASRSRMDGVSFRWLRDGSELPEPSGSPLSLTHPHGTHSVRSQLTVRQEEWSPGSSYTCIVTQENLSTPPSYTGTARHVEMKTPEVWLLEIKGHESLANDAMTKLACFVSAFYPANISVTWRSQNGDPIDGWTTFPVTADTEGTFNVVSVISVPRETWEKGQTFTCVLVHQSSEEPIERHLGKDNGTLWLYGHPLWIWEIVAICLLIVYTVIIVILTHCCKKCIQAHCCCGRTRSHSLWTGSGIPMDLIQSRDLNKKTTD